MPNDPILDRLRARKDRLDTSIERMETDGAAASSWDGKWSVTRIELDRLRYERDLVAYKILQRGGQLNEVEVNFGGTVKRTPVASSSSDA